MQYDRSDFSNRFLIKLRSTLLKTQEKIKIFQNVTDLSYSKIMFFSKELLNFT